MLFCVGLMKMASMPSLHGKGPLDVHGAWEKTNPFVGPSACMEGGLESRKGITKRKATGSGSMVCFTNCNSLIVAAVAEAVGDEVTGDVLHA